MRTTTKKKKKAHSKRGNHSLTSICSVTFDCGGGSLFESSQSLFWASFGMVGLENFELEGIKSYTRKFLKMKRPEHILILKCAPD